MPRQQQKPSTAPNSSSQHRRPEHLLLQPLQTAVLDIPAEPGKETVSLVLDSYDPDTGLFLTAFRLVVRTSFGKDRLHEVASIPIAETKAPDDRLMHVAQLPQAAYRLRVEHSGSRSFAYSVSTPE